VPPAPALTGAVVEPGVAPDGDREPARPVAVVPAHGRARYATLDGLRFVAAALVVAYHFTAYGSAAWGEPASAHFPALHRVTAFGAFGVDLFFVISGFVILMSAWGRDVVGFAASRVGRIFPAYWVAVLATGTLLLALWPQGKKVSGDGVALNLTMLQTAFGVGNVDGVYWTLWAELRFYVLVAVLLAVGLTTLRLYAVVLLWPAVAAICATQGLQGIGTLLIAPQASFFAGGMALYLVARDRRSFVAWAALACNVLVATTVGARPTTRAVAAATGVDAGRLGGALVVAACFAAVAVAVLTPLRRVHLAWLTTLGLLTYPLYLLHEYWGWWIVAHVRGRTPDAVALALAVAAALGAAWAVHRWVERPWGPRLRRRVEGELRRAVLRDRDEARRRSDPA
jgi:peptidoglycan/LPS O-acetylase OafA/YrhL